MNLSVQVEGLSEGLIIPDSSAGLKKWAPHIMYFLEKQEASWNKYWSLEDLVLKIIRDEFVPVLYFRNGELLGMAMVSLQRYNVAVFNMRIEFLSCENMFALIPMLGVLEERARLLGCTAIEAVAHPTIAKYAQKKHGFEAPMQFITKTLEPIRRH